MQTIQQNKKPRCLVGVNMLMIVEHFARHAQA